MLLCMPDLKAGLAELVDALDSGSSVRKNFRVQVPGSALNWLSAVKQQGNLSWLSFPFFPLSLGKVQAFENSVKV